MSDCILPPTPLITVECSPAARRHLLCLNTMSAVDTPVLAAWFLSSLFPTLLLQRSWEKNIHLLGFTVASLLPIARRVVRSIWLSCSGFPKTSHPTHPCSVPTPESHGWLLIVPSLTSALAFMLLVLDSESHRFL